jgi:hypothetical protein
MATTFRRITPALVLTIGALALVGCGSSNSSGGGGGGATSGTNGGGSGSTLTAKEWQAKMQSISSQLTAAFQPVKTNGQDPTTWFTLATTLKHIQSEVASLNPPSVAVGVNDAIASGMQPLSGEATAIGNDLKNHDQNQAKQDATSLERSLLALLSKISQALLKLHGTGGTST